MYLYRCRSLKQEPNAELVDINLMKLISKNRLVGLAIIIAAILIFVFLKATKPKQPPIEITQKVWPIETININTAEFSPVYTLYGTVESHALVTAASPVSGVISNVNVKDGDKIHAGQLLASLAEVDINTPLQIAQADVQDTQAQLKLQDLAYRANRTRLKQERDVLTIKKAEVKRNRELLKKKLVSQSTLDKAIESLRRQQQTVVNAELLVAENKAKVDQLGSRLAKAQASLEQAVINKKRSRVTAPYNGRIASVKVSAGDRVAVNQAMLSYYAFDSLELRARIPAAQIPTVHQALQSGNKLVARYQHQHQQLDLPLSRLAGNATLSGVDAFFDLPESMNWIRPGELLEVKLIGQPIPDSIALPYSALYGSDRIYKVEQGQLVAVKVKLLGETEVDGELMVLVSADLQAGSVVSTTHLPNAISGLKVSVVDKNNE